MRRAEINAHPASNLVAPTIPLAAHALLACAGWEIVAVDIDLAAGRASMDVRRHDGRWLRANMSAHGASVERWQRDRATARASRRAASYDGVSDTFLGRERCPDARAALRSVAHYLADNPATGYAALPHEQTMVVFALFVARQE